MTYQQLAFQSASEGIIKNLKKRGMEGYFYEDSKSCVQEILKLLPAGCSIAWGGSMTLTETGMMSALESGSYELIDRMKAKSPQESREFHAKAVLSDFYFMSTNAITLDGELINVDGRANRVGCLAYGPNNVIILAGMNKLVTNVEEGIHRAFNIAAPANAKRLSKNTPCGIAGRCADCQSPDCMCSQIVITRHSMDTGRIKVYLIAENLGF